MKAFNWRKHGVWSGSCNPFIQVIRAYTVVANKGTMVTPALYGFFGAGGQEVTLAY